MATESEKRLYRCCFTGHRPHKLTRPATDIQQELEAAIRKAIDDGFRVFITGMAQGVDIWAAQIVLRLRDEGYAIRLICACPFDGFEQRWPPFWKMQYREILNKADFVKFVSSSYSSNCFQIRNEWLVNHSSRVIAVYNGEPSGTRNTIKYAEKTEVDVYFIKG